MSKYDLTLKADVLPNDLGKSKSAYGIGTPFSHTTIYFIWPFGLKKHGVQKAYGIKDKPRISLEIQMRFGPASVSDNCYGKLSEGKARFWGPNTFYGCSMS